MVLEQWEVILVIYGIHTCSHDPEFFDSNIFPSKTALLMLEFIQDIKILKDQFAFINNEIKRIRERNICLNNSFVRNVRPWTR